MANDSKKRSGSNASATDNDQRKTAQGKKQKDADKKTSKSAGPSIGSHKPGGDGPGTKKFKYEADDSERKRKRA